MGADARPEWRARLRQTWTRAQPRLASAALVLQYVFVVCWSWLHRAWTRVHQPRFVSVAYFLQYAILAAAGSYALVNPPGSIEGPIGALAMTMLASLLIVGSLIGAIAVLPGRYFLERLAVIAVALAGSIYVAVVIGLHVSSPGNRLLQAGFVSSFLIHQAVRWYRIKDRDYRPAPGVVEA